LGKAKIVCFGGILTALSVMFQIAPVVLPGVGLALSPLSTAPAAIAAFLSPAAGIIAYLSAGLLLLLLDTQEALIFLLSTGALGLVLGLLLHNNFFVRTLASGFTLFCGINILFYGFGINLFGPATAYVSGFIEAFFILFSVLYAAAWSVILKLLFKPLKALGFLGNPVLEKLKRSKT
jgi:hypothetical protein